MRSYAAYVLVECDLENTNTQRTQKYVRPIRMLSTTLRAAIFNIVYGFYKALASGQINCTCTYFRSKRGY